MKDKIENLMETGDERVIMLSDVWKTYQTGAVSFTALHGVNLDINRGELTAIMGPSGSGKSTLMNILGCLDHKDRGEYFLNGTSISDLSAETLALIRNQEIGFVFQSFNLLPKLNLLENVALPMVYAGIRRQERLARANQLLDEVDLLRWALHKPTELSGGQKQRAAIARAMVMRPALLLADEPTGNLDTASSSEIMKIFGRLNAEGSTIVIITHESHIAHEARRIVHLVDGRIVSDTKGRNAPVPKN
jgi:putative ABC transport system ATP-binding protein